MKVAHPRPSECMADDGSALGDAGRIAIDSAAAVRNLKQAFPRLKLCYVVTRTYGGYALIDLNPEPFAYETGWGVKWLIDAQIDETGAFGDLNWDPKQGPVVAPWLSWGSYFWANGLEPNQDGICWELDDFHEGDRTHPAPSGVDKVGTAFLQFFLNDSTSRSWFRGACGLAGDFDDDCDIDKADVEAFMGCAAGSDIALVPECASKDLDGDGDQRDFGLLQLNLSEEPVPDGPGCGQG